MPRPPGRKVGGRREKEELTQMVFDFLKRAEAAVPEQKASAAGPVINYSGTGRVAWSPRDTVSLTKTGFLGNPIGSS